MIWRDIEGMEDTENSQDEKASEQNKPQSAQSSEQKGLKNCSFSYHLVIIVVNLRAPYVSVVF